MTKFIQFNFIFDRYPTEIHLPTFYVILGFFILLFLLGLTFALFASKKEKADKIIAKFFNKVSNWGLWSGIIGLLITFFRYERVAYLGMRFWTIIWLLFIFGWFILILKYFLKDVPKLKKEKERKKEFEKYLP